MAVEFTVTNTGTEALPASMGAHPAFQWPLVQDVPKESHRLEFSEADNGATRRLANGLLLPKAFPDPVDGRILKLDEALFADDAVIFDQPRSRRIRYGAPGANALEISWDEGFRELGLWSKPGAGFLCIEPWHGMSSPEDFDGEIMEKPGVMIIPPGESRKAGYWIKILAGDDAVPDFV